MSVTKTQMNDDKAGIDYKVALKGGAEINIDMKSRTQGCSKYWIDKNDPEIPIELYSVIKIEEGVIKPGWTKDLNTNVDYLIFRFNENDSKNVYLVPFQMLRLALMQFEAEWRKQYKVWTQKSDCWTSQAMFIPISVVMSAIQKISIVNVCQ